MNNIPTPRAQIDDIVVIQLQYSYQQIKVTHAYCVDTEWVYTCERKDVKRQGVTDQDILMNLTTGIDYQIPVNTIIDYIGEEKRLKTLAQMYTLDPVHEKQLVYVEETNQRYIRNNDKWIFSKSI